MQICPSCGEENPPRFRLCGYCGTALAPAMPAQETRKTVSVVFSDLKGSTNLGEQLDSEALREVMGRYFDEMRSVLEHHGGTVEKYIGDAIMAVFGLPRVHEDDALRAVRAAFGMKQSLAALNDELEERWGVRLTNRTGVNTGEVVAGDASTGQRLVTGDTVNVAARLEQAAPALEILVGEPTYRLVRDAVDVEEVDPLELKGKAERVPAYRLLGVRDSAQRGARSPLVGRERELGLLREALDGVERDRAPRLVTVLAEPGVGKTRLLEELEASLAERATVVRGRCLPYGRGITFWPVVEMVRGVARIDEADATDEAVAKLDVLVPGAPEVTSRVAVAMGLVEADYALEELFWGVRKLLEALAAERPVVAVFEDVHWAESALLDLVEHAVAAAETPLLLVCAARPELLEQREEWGQGPRASSFELGPLSAADSVLVASNLLGGVPLAADVAERIGQSAEGNPLFVEQMLAMLLDDGSLRRTEEGWEAATDLGELAMPGSIQALLSARLDGLTREERAVVEPASVIGLVFPEAAVAELVPDGVRPGLSQHLVALERKRLIRSDGADRAEDAFRFQHILVRDAAYGGLLKRARATLHERFAEWGERVNRDRARGGEYEEILGYHFEQAHRYLGELGPLDEHGRALGVRAAERLAAAGRRAFGRGDMGAAANLLRRAAGLYPEGDARRHALLPGLGEAMMETGEFAWAQVYLDEGVAAAGESGDLALLADATLTRLLVRHHVTDDLEAWRAEVVRETDALVPAHEAELGDAVLAKVWRLLGFVHGSVCRWEATAAAEQRAIHHARLAGDRRQEARVSAAYTIALRDGPTPVHEAIPACEEIVARGLVDRQAEALVLCSLAYLHAMAGQFDAARDGYRRAAGLLRDLGRGFVPWMALVSARVELLAGEAPRAEAELRRDYAALGELGERYVRPLVGALLAQAIYAQGRREDALTLAEEVRDLADPDDVETQAVWRGVRAKVLAAAGDVEEAEALAREAVELLAPTDAPVVQADALSDLAEVLRAAGRAGEAQAALDRALSLYERKRHAVAAAAVRALGSTGGERLAASV